MKRLALCFIAVLFAMCLAACGGIAESEGPPEEIKHDRIPMVMVDGVLYYDTGRESAPGPRCGTMDGEITSTVEAWEVPEKDCQSNFGVGYGYQYGAEGTIEVSVNDTWIIFRQRSENEEKTIAGGVTDEPSWIDWYNGIKKDDQNAVINVPANLAKLMGGGTGSVG